MNNGEVSPEEPHTDTAGMLFTEAAKVAESVFVLQNTTLSARETWLGTLYEQLKSVENRPPLDKQVDLIIRQGKVAIETQLTEHAEAALRYAVYVRFSHDNQQNPRISPGATAAYQRCLQSMITALMLANRHLAMLEALKNLEGKHYSVRAAKGGHAKAGMQPSRKMTSLLIHAMVKGMLYNKPEFANKNKTDVADAMATRIYKINREFEMLDITNLDNLKHEVRNSLFDLSNIGTRVNPKRADRLKLGHILTNSFPKANTEEARHMDVEASRTLGFIQGAREVLTQLLVRRFGELTSSTLQALEATDDLDQLQTYLDRLADAQSLNDVISDI